MNDSVELINISKSYDGKKKIKVLNNVNYKFKKGKIYSLMGPSGSGKSTLLNLISLIDTPSSGILKMNNLKIDYNNQSNNDDIRSKNIGIIYQDKNLLSDFTALENVYLARITSGIDKKKALDQSINILKKVGLSNRLNHFTSDLSGGESQRVAISRALINTPKIILADEPTGSLDHQTSKDIFRLLFRQKNKDRIIIYATHNRYFANMADCKISLVDGKIKSGNARF
tara:strand:- start:5733 stop:6416 length:684 start_codon:yes stop_codon:yes gene_type:complete